MSRLMLIGAASAAALALAACGDNTDTADNTPMTNDTAMNDTAMNDSTMATTPAPATDAMEENAKFVNAVGQASMAEIQTSEMALKTSKNAEVKAFAQKIIDDHKAASEKLKSIAASSNLPAPPAALDDFHMRRIDDLTEDDGNDDFDADYAAMQVDMHNDAIDLVKDYADNADANPDLKAFAMEVLPKLQMHKDMAEKLKDQVKS